MHFVELVLALCIHMHRQLVSAVRAAVWAQRGAKNAAKKQMARAKVHIYWRFQLLQMTGYKDRYDTRLQAELDLVSPAILVREHASAVAAIFVPLPVVSPSVRPHHESPPCHHIVHPFSLVPA